MPLAAGTRLGSYEILALIGAGGMGEVYRARDTRLERTVAIKVLPEHVAGDPDLRQRFEREAKAISSLNHPHICTLYDVGSEGGVEYLVMEHLDGETLTLRLLKGAIPFPLVLRYAVEIAEALDRAHRQGITHRDLKPGNVMLTKAGAKLLDFGLAKLNAAAPVQMSSAATASPDLLTASGTILGTLQYMAPEQLEGKPVDHRADIFSFGAIVYEMATGRKAFDGDSQARLIGAILKDEPRPVSALQPLSQPVFDALIATCLAKDPDDRWQSAGDIGRQLRLLQSGSSQPALSASSPTALSMPTSARQRGSRSVAYAATAIVAAVAGAATIWGFMRPTPRAPLPVSRFTITPSADAPLADVTGYDVAISPDGRRVAYVARSNQNDRTGVVIFVRDLDSLVARFIPGTETPPIGNPFFSPDGRSLAFASTERLMRVALDGGPPLPIAALPQGGNGFAGGAWGASDTVILSTANALYRVSAGGGGTPERLASEGSSTVVGPVLLPGGRGLLFGVLEGDRPRVNVLDLVTRVERTVAEGGENAAYASGYLIFARGSTLMAQPFDVEKLDVAGEAVAVLQDVRRVNGAADFALAANGTLVYVPSGGDASTKSALVWVDRAGHVVARAVDDLVDNPIDVRLSPDGRRVALTSGVIANRTSGTADLWVHDLDGRPPIRLASGGINGVGTWSPDGKTIAFTSNRNNGRYEIYTLPSDGSSRDPQLARELEGTTTAWTRAGDMIGWRFATNQGDIYAARADGQGDVRDLVATTDTEGSPSLSPDERWLTYVSDRTGRLEVWVKPYPDGVPVRVSRSGGAEPVWSRDGREIFYRQNDSLLTVALDTSGPTLSFKGAVELFKEPSYLKNDDGQLAMRTYDVAPDGRFLMIQRAGDTSGAVQSASIVVIENWIEEVKRRLPLH
jgi:serine/threonine protein kinase/Tol biopolymer transport system component